MKINIIQVWGQISLGDKEVRFITTIDNSGGMPSQDREDAGIKGSLRTQIEQVSSPLLMLVDLGSGQRW